MAGFEFIAQTVEEAKKEIWGPIGELQSLLGLYRLVDDGDLVSWSLLAHGSIERMLAAFEMFEQLLREQGHPITFPVTKSVLERHPYSPKDAPEPYPCFMGVTNVDTE